MENGSLLCGLLIGWDPSVPPASCFFRRSWLAPTHTQNQVEQQNKGWKARSGSASPLTGVEATRIKLRFNSNVSLRLLTPLSLSPLTASRRQVQAEPLTDRIRSGSCGRRRLRFDTPALRAACCSLGRELQRSRGFPEAPWIPVFPTH